MMVWNGQPDCWTGSFSITMENEFGLAPLWCAALRLVLWAVVVAITIHLLHCNAWYSNVCLLMKGEHNVQATDEQGNFSSVFLKCRKTPPTLICQSGVPPGKCQYVTALFPLIPSYALHPPSAPPAQEEVGWRNCCGVRGSRVASYQSLLTGIT